MAHYLPRSGHAFYRPCVIPVANWFLGRRTGHGLTLTEVCTYTAAQVLGAVGGSVLANAMFEVGTSISGKDRATGGHQLAEVVATAGLLALVFALVRTGRGAIAAPAVGAYIGAAYWFTSSIRSPTPPSPSVASSPTRSPGSPPLPRSCSSPPNSSAWPSVSPSRSPSTRTSATPSTTW